ncbi:MAG: TonB-dependent receptor [Verrucomicrobiales bacterium]|nr:TonB-dependent receptor [Verrucomicrobiales bacterium]
MNLHIPAGHVRSWAVRRSGWPRQGKAAPTSGIPAFGTACFGLLVSTVLSCAQTDMTAQRLEKLSQLSLEDLIVTSVSKKSEKLFDAAAAVSVITNEELRRSGVLSIPEALRLVPGLEVARLDGTKWAISTRGFTDRFATKLLVLIDGRAVYQPAFGGVYWDAQDYLLEDIDRIEVIRGPGGTLWGANAVNGVINIITKNSTETAGGYLTGGYGTEERGFGAIRYGHSLGEHGFFRAYLKYRNIDELALAAGRDAFDASETVQGGFRTDWHLGENEVTFQGDYYYGNRQEENVEPIFQPPYGLVRSDDYPVKGANLLSRWTHTFANETDLQLQAYWDYWERNSSLFDYALHTFDVDFQHRLALPLRQEFIYGLNYRALPDHSRNVDPTLQFFPASTSPQVFGAFVQDEIALVPDRLKLTLGSKFEHNDYTGFEWQPNIRLAWTPSPHHTLWAAVSRPVRTPARNETAIRLNILTPNGQIFPRGFGNPEFGSERLTSYELGYRVTPLEKLSFDLAAYYFVFDGVESAEVLVNQIFTETSPPPPHSVLPVAPGNAGRAETYGLELGAEYQAQDWWRLRGGYNVFNYRKQERTSLSNAASPRHQLFFRSSMDLPGQVEFDVWGRYRSSIAVYDLDSYVDVDVRLGWKPHKSLEIAVVGQNLAHTRRREFGFTPGIIDTPVSQVQRSVYGQLTWRF